MAFLEETIGVFHIFCACSSCGPVFIFHIAMEPIDRFTTKDDVSCLMGFKHGIISFFFLKKNGDNDGIE